MRVAFLVLVRRQRAKVTMIASIRGSSANRAVRVMYCIVGDEKMELALCSGGSREIGQDKRFSCVIGLQVFVGIKPPDKARISFE